MSLREFSILISLAVISCSSSDPLTSLKETGGKTLSPGNTSGQDEDPSILLAKDNSLYVAWYSNRNGEEANGAEDKEIFLMRTTDGTAWSDPVQITKSSSYAFYPSLAQDASGTFHLAWWRVTPIPEGCNPSVPLDCTGTDNRILYKNSSDGVTWDLGKEKEIATGPGDWLSSMVVDKVDDRLLVYFSAVARDENGTVNLGETTLRLFVVIRDGGKWGPVTPLVGVNSNSTHNTYPHVVQRSDGKFLMTWTRYDGSAPNDPLQVIQEPSTQTMYATSNDGVTWTTPHAKSDDSALDVFPYLYHDHSNQNWFISWLTTAFSASGSVIELLTGGDYPTEVVQRPELTGYTARILATPTNGIYWGVWVEGETGKQKLHHRFFRRE